MKVYKVRFPGSFYAHDFRAASEADARRQARNWLGKPRLPRGTEVWEFTPASQRVVRDSRREMARDYAKAGQIFD